MDKQSGVYVTMMVDTLRQKEQILTSLYDKTREQEVLLKDEDMDADRFSQLIEEKGIMIERLNQMDEGFNALFKLVEDAISADRDKYKNEIQTMQKLISVVSELGIQIQALEKQNSGHFQIYLANQRKQVREFHQSSRTAANYYQNMANVHRADQSYFMNETK